MSGSAVRPTDLTERLDEGYLHSLFHIAGLGIVACDSQGRVIACNPAAVELFGEIEPGHLNVPEAFPEADRPHVERIVAGVVESLEPYEYHTQLGRDEFGPREYAIWFTPVIEPDGALRGVALWARDITKRRRLQRKLKKNERLAYLGKLAGAVAHHYNNLLCSIATSVDYAMNMNTMTAMRRASQRTADAVGRAADITRQLLAFAQADHHPGADADLAATIREYFARAEQRLANQRITLDLRLHETPPVTVPREHFIIILENLVSNAIDAMPEGGALVVELSPLGPDIVCLSVTDTGSGISASDMEHLFEPFYTSKGVLADGKSTNAGLGLAVVHGLASEMHGAVTAANVLEGGARFDLVLPVERSSERNGRSRS